MCACSVLPDPMDYSLLVSSVHGIFQTRILGPFPLPGVFLNSGIKPSSFILCIDRWILYHWATWKAQNGGFYKWTSSGIRELSLWLSLTIYILLVLLQIWKIKGEGKMCVWEREREKKNRLKILLTLKSAKLSWSEWNGCLSSRKDSCHKSNPVMIKLWMSDCVYQTWLQAKTCVVG